MDLLSKNKVYAIFCALILIFGSLFWFFLKNIFFEYKSIDLPFYCAYYFFDLIVLIALYSLSFLLFKNWQQLLFLGVLGILPLFILIPINKIVILSLLIMILSTLLGLKSINQASKKHLDLDIYSITYQGSSYILTGIFVIIASFYYISPSLEIEKANIIIPKPVVEKAFNFVTEYLSQSEALKDRKVELPETFFDFLNKEIKTFISNFKNYIALTFSIGLFLALRAFNFLIIPFITFITTFIFKIFLIAKMIKIKEEKVIAQRIMINF